MGLPGAHGGDREPTPRAQDTSVERHTARESIAWFANDLGGEAAPAILGLAAQLSDGQATALASMLGRLDTAYMYKHFDQERALWRALEAHLPGLAPTLELLRAHLQDVPSRGRRAMRAKEGEARHLRP